MPNTRDDWQKRVDKALEVLAEATAMGFMPIQNMVEKMMGLADGLRDVTPTFGQGDRDSAEEGLGMVREMFGVEGGRGMNPGTDAAHRYGEAQGLMDAPPGPSQRREDYGNNNHWKGFDLPQMRAPQRREDYNNNDYREARDLQQIRAPGMTAPQPTQMRRSHPAPTRHMSPDQIMSMPKDDFERIKEEGLRGRHSRLPEMQERAGAMRRRRGM